MEVILVVVIARGAAIGDDDGHYPPSKVTNVPLATVGCKVAVVVATYHANYQQQEQRQQHSVMI